MKLIEQCRDLYGSLSQQNQRVIEDMIIRPSFQTWELARRIVISPTPLLTLDMAVHRVTEDASRNTLPDSFTIYRALDYAIKRHELYLSKPINVGAG